MGLFDWLKKKDTPARADTPAGAAWKVGDRVLAKWHDAFFYPGKIRGMKGKNCQVHFDDGDIAWVHQAHIRTPDIEVGSRVFGRVQGGPLYAPGVVSQRKGETIQIRYDHGEDEWTSISFVRVERTVADVGGEALPPPPGPVKQELGPVSASDWREGSRDLCSLCHQADPEEGYAAPLCPTCRTMLVQRPIPRWILGSGLAVLVVLGVASFRAVTTMQAGIAFERGQRADKKHNYREASQQYQRAAEFLPDSTLVLARLGIAYFKAGEFNEAARTLHKLAGRQTRDTLLVNEINSTIKQLHVMQRRPQFRARERE